MATNLFDLYAKISLDDTEFNNGLDSASSKFGLFGKGFDKISSVGKKAFKAVGVAAAAGGAALGAFMKSSVDTGMTFDKAMSQVAATMGLSMDEINIRGSEANRTFQSLRDAAIHYGETTAFTSTQASEALNYMALAGYDAETAISTLPAVLNLAAAGSLDLGYASDMITDSQTALGLTLEQTNILMDQMAMAASKSNTSVGQLGEAILTVGGTAKYMAGGTEELSSVIGVLADNGIKGSEAGTHLRNIILKLASPTEAGAIALEKLGVSIFDAEGKMKSFSKIFPELNAAMSKLTEEQKLQALSKIFNVRDIASANALLGTTAERWEELGEYIENADGAMEQMAATQLDNLAGDITILNSAMDGLKIAISDEVMPALREFAQKGTKYIGRVKNALTNKGWRGALREVSGILGEMLNAFISYLPKIADVAVQMISTFIDSISANSGSIIEAGGLLLDSLVKGLSQIKSKVMPVISQFVPLIVENFLTYKAEMFKLGFDILLAILDGISQNIDSISDSAVEIITDLIDYLGENLPRLLETGGNIISHIVDAISEHLPDLVSSGIDILDSIVKYISENLPGIVTMGAEFINQVITTITEALPNLATIASDILTQLVSFLVENLPGILTMGGDLISQVVTTISEALPNLATIASDILTQLVSFLVENLPGILTMGGDLISQVVTTISEALPNLATIASDILTQLVSFLVENLPGILTMGGDLISQVVTTISEALPGLADAAVDILEQIVSSILDNLPGILSIGIDIIDQLCTTITENLPGLLQSGIDMLNQILQGFMDTLPDLIAEIPEMITQLVGSITENLPSIITAGGDILTSILDGFAQLFTDIPGVISDMWDSFSTAVSEIDWLDLGKNIIDGVIEGLNNTVGKVVTAAKNVFDSVVNGVKNFLGIHSPSTVFSDIGVNMVEGLQQGWDSEIGRTKGDIESDLDFGSAAETSASSFENSGSTIASSAGEIGSSISTNFGASRDAIQNFANSTSTLMSSLWSALTNLTNNSMNQIKNVIQNTYNNINSSIANSMNRINSVMTTGLNYMQSAVQSRLNSILNQFVQTFNTARQVVNQAVADLKNAMNFTWSLPHLKMPHISISGKFSLDPPSAPKFSVSWYRKAMDNAMLLNGATIFGMMGDKFLGGGEAGQEVVSGSDTLMKMIRDAVRSENTGIGTVNINIDGAKYDDVNELAEVIAEKIQGIADRRKAVWA